MAQNPLQSFMKECREVQDGRRKIYIPKKKETCRLKDTRLVVKFEIGERNITVKEKVVLLLGSTGSGKSLLVNMIFNYLLGIQWEDDFRFKLVDEEGRSQADSQTDYVTVYTIHHQPWFRAQFSLTLIDTPGYGDTRGIKRDQELTDNLKQMFASEDGYGVEVIDVVGFVVQASWPRLTSAQRYILESILALFGKDVEENLFVFATFADRGKPQVVEMLKKVSLPFEEIFKFNNVCYYDKVYDDDEEGEEEEIFGLGLKMYWKMGQKSFERLLFHLDRTSPKSLRLSRDVLNKRTKLETLKERVHREIKVMISKVLQLNVEKQIIQRFQSVDLIDSSKQITFETIEVIATTEATLPEQNTTNCLNCWMTCHESCSIADDKDKDKCDVMKNGYCEICPENCHYTFHRNQAYVYVMEAQKLTSTYEDLTHKYGNVGDQILSYKHLIKCYNEVQTAQARILLLVEKARDCVSRLNQIALRPSSWSTSEHLEMLIVAQKSEGNSGWQDRVQLLETIKEKADQMLDPHGATPMTVDKYVPNKSEPTEPTNSSEGVVIPEFGPRSEIALPKTTTGQSQGQFTCTKCNRKYKASAMVFLFGSLKSSEIKQTTFVKVKAFLCSTLCNIKQFLLDLMQQNDRYELELVGEQGIHVKTTNFDPTKSKVTMMVRSDDDQEAWAPHPKDHDLWSEDKKRFDQSSDPLPGVLDFDGCHHCRSPNIFEAMSIDSSSYPLDAMTVDMKTQRMTSEFNGVFRLTIHGAVMSSVPDSEENTSVVKFADNSITIGFTLREQQTQQLRLLRKRHEQMRMTMNPGSVSALTGAGAAASNMMSLPVNVPSQNTLCDRHILELSKRITDEDTFQQLGNSLGLPFYELGAIEYNNPQKITIATHKMLHKWLRTKTDRTTAWHDLADVLKRDGLQFYVLEVLNRTYSSDT